MLAATDGIMYFVKGLLTLKMTDRTQFIHRKIRAVMLGFRRGGRHGYGSG
jgi:hypothetical protein